MKTKKTPILMTKYLSLLTALLLLSGVIGCKNKNETTTTVETLNTPEEVQEQTASTIENHKRPEDFIPRGYVPFDTITGDFNKDGLEDYILIIKGTDKSKVITDEYRGKLDRKSQRNHSFIKQK